MSRTPSPPPAPHPSAYRTFSQIPVISLTLYGKPHRVLLPRQHGTLTGQYDWDTRAYRITLHLPRSATLTGHEITHTAACADVILEHLDIFTGEILRIAIDDIGFECVVGLGGDEPDVANALYRTWRSSLLVSRARKWEEEKVWRQAHPVEMGHDSGVSKWEKDPGAKLRGCWSHVIPRSPPNPSDPVLLEQMLRIKKANFFS